MQINSTNNYYSLFVNKTSYTTKKLSNNSTTFKGLDPEVEKNQYKILSSQDIWSPKLAVKMPDSDIEKEALLEILEQRAKLDRYTYLNNKRASILTKKSYAEDLSKTEPNNPDLAKTLEELNKLGNISAVLKTLDKEIEQEKTKNKSAHDYFTNLSKLEDEYEEKKLIKNSQREKFWHKIIKGNINSNGEYKTSELIKIIKNGTKQEVKTIEKTPVPHRITSKKDMLNLVKSEYRDALCETINPYLINNNHCEDAQNARTKVEKTHASNLKRFALDSKKLNIVYKFVEREYNAHIDELNKVPINHLGEHYSQMEKIEMDLRDLKKEEQAINNCLKISPNNENLQTALINNHLKSDVSKEEWIKRAIKSVEYEGLNREIMADAGKIKQYEYLTDKNRTIRLHRDAVIMMKENNGTIPEEMWTKILYPQK